ncbi:hypothetical protein [Amphritea balenae]|uniref:Uncharacterized protein n=1 Tax=Amphritea balenae TaxID=452629 RepID=A0A3P1SWH5_9GAMM|nr:hypothetical protein [Amphritea balenae]RRD01325.1 hypothetical protein EHS89_01830 [Amphritea balenae]GGK58123.1 hypothetical protein GCM10007941_05300 [Amphritea balenae]
MIAPENDMLQLSGNVLVPFDTMPVIPKELVEEFKGDFDVYEFYISEIVASSRGYQATWAFVGNQLWLSSIEGVKQLSEDVCLFANWFTGTLAVHMPYSPGELMVIQFEEGVAINSQYEFSTKAAEFCFAAYKEKCLRAAQ